MQQNQMLSALDSLKLDGIGADIAAYIGVNFGRPWVLLLLLFIPLWPMWRRKQKLRLPAIPFSRAATLAAGPRGAKPVVRLAPWLRALAVAALLVAIAQPRTGARAENVDREGIDIALAVDISSSMLSEDFQPQNRIEVAKDKVKRFVMGRKNDRVGLIAFSGEALTQVPPHH